MAQEIKIVSGCRTVAVYHSKDRIAALRWAARMSRVRKCLMAVHENDVFVKSFDGRK